MEGKIIRYFPDRRFGYLRELGTSRIGFFISMIALTSRFPLVFSSPFRRAFTKAVKKPSVYGYSPHRKPSAVYGELRAVLQQVHSAHPLG